MSFHFQTIWVLAVLAIASVYSDEETDPHKFKTAEVAGTSQRDKLLDDLFSKYKVDNYPENSTVKFGLSIVNVNFCEEHDLMNTNVWLRMVWGDNRLMWDANETGISVLRVPSTMVWLPDITLYNSVHPSMDCFQSNVLLYPNGQVLWVPPCTLKSYCNLTLTQHPFKEQICTLKFGSWTFDGLTMGLELYGAKKEADLDDYAGHKYRVTKSIAVVEEKHYDCCVEPYMDILYTLGFTRRTEGEIACDIKQ